MNKKEFIQNLKSNLKHLQKEELEEVISDYTEHFEIGISEGRKEHEISKSLGNPKTIAKSLTAHHHIKVATENKTAKNITRAILSVIGLSFFNLIFILGPFIGIFATLIAIFITGFTMSIAGIGSIFLVIIGILQMGVSFWTGTFLLLACSTAGILITIGNYYLTKWFLKIMLKYLKFNIKVIGINEVFEK